MGGSAKSEVEEREFCPWTSSRCRGGSEAPDSPESSRDRECSTADGTSGRRRARSTSGRRTADGTANSSRAGTATPTDSSGLTSGSRTGSHMRSPEPPIRRGQQERPKKERVYAWTSSRALGVFPPPLFILRPLGKSAIYRSQLRRFNLRRFVRRGAQDRQREVDKVVYRLCKRCA